MHVAMAVTAVVEILQPDMPDEEAQAMTAIIERRGYTAPELAWATEQLLVDASLDKKLSFEHGRISAADFDRVIEKNRSVRRQLSMPLRQIDVNRLVAENPSILSMDDFGVCSYDSFEQPLYRFNFQGPVKNAPSPSPTIELPEDTGSDRVRGENHEPTSIGSLIEVPKRSDNA